MRMTKVLKRCDTAADYHPTQEQLLQALRQEAEALQDMSEDKVIALYTTLLRLCRMNSMDP